LTEQFITDTITIKFDIERFGLILDLTIKLDNSFITRRPQLTSGNEAFFICKLPYKTPVASQDASHFLSICPIGLWSWSSATNKKA
jgi:hypothetical protein